jgi:hypothetical protein
MGTLEDRMAVKNLFMTTTNPTSPLDGSGGANGDSRVSDFLTVQSLANFAAMTGAITAAWNGMQRLWPDCSTLWVPFWFAVGWAIVSILMSLSVLLKPEKWMDKVSNVVSAVFVAAINLLVLFAAVVGANNVATSPSP